MSCIIASELSDAAASPADAPLDSRSSATRRRSRLPACAVCQRRKLKCSRGLPCTNCVRSKSECVPGTLARRKARFPERALLQRIRHYEQLLQHNHINFEPLHGYPAGGDAPPHSTHRPTSGDECHVSAGASFSSSPSSSQHGKENATKNFWHVMNQRVFSPVRRSCFVSPVDLASQFQDFEADQDSSHDDGSPEPGLKKAIKADFETADCPFFASNTVATNLAVAHPDAAQIFRLWDIYVANVSPLLKVVHTPTVQRRIVEAASDVQRIDPNLEALMFSIYGLAVASLDQDKCEITLGAPKQDLAKKYQTACWQALLNAKFLRTCNRDCLTALYLYLISVMPTTDPSSLSSMLGLAIRIARRMGLHSEPDGARHAPFEAEMRRRLWWSLVILDFRVSEMASHGSSELGTPWDCRMPLDVSDQDLQPGMEEPPKARSRCTDALFLAVLCELSGLVLRSSGYSNSGDPAMRRAAKAVHHGPREGGSESQQLEATIEDRYLQFCDAGIPAHFATMCVARAYIAKFRLIEYYGELPDAASSLTDARRDEANRLALAMLDLDTKLVTSPLSQGFHWFAALYFPALAHMHLLHDLKCRPLSEHAEQAWDAISNNYLSRHSCMGLKSSHTFRFLANLVLQAWALRESTLQRQGGAAPEPPRVVAYVRERLAAALSGGPAGQQPSPGAGGSAPTAAVSTGPNVTGEGGSEALDGMSVQDSAAVMWPMAHPQLGAQASMHVDEMPVVWPAVGWGRPGFPWGVGRSTPVPWWHQFPTQHQDP